MADPDCRAVATASLLFPTLSALTQQPSLSRSSVVSCAKTLAFLSLESKNCEWLIRHMVLDTCEHLSQRDDIEVNKVLSLVLRELLASETSMWTREHNNALEKLFILLTSSAQDPASLLNCADILCSMAFHATLNIEITLVRDTSQTLERLWFERRMSF